MKEGTEMPRGIVIFGANGCGKTRLGRELSRRLGCRHMDVEEYSFRDSEIPYAAPRPAEERRVLMLRDMKRYGTFLLSAVNGDFGREINEMYRGAVYLSAPLSIRMDRIRQRSYEKFGDRVREGGDLFEQEQAFWNFAAARSLAALDKWADTLQCPVIRVDASRPVQQNADHLAPICKELLGL